MSKEKKGLIILSVIILLLLGVIVYLLTHKTVEKEFLVKVQESYNGFSLVEPYQNNNISKDYPIMEINVGDLSEGDIIRIKTDGSFRETYPPKINVKEYEYVLNTSNSSTTTTTTKAPEESIHITEDNRNNNTTTTKTTTTKTTTTTTTAKTTTKIQTTLSKDDTIINNLNEKISNIELNKNNKSFKENVKKYFTDVVDFIFYDKPIKGVYFKELTNKAKLTVIKLTLKLDTLADRYFPNYKENLNNKYQNIKGKLVEFYLDKTAEYCANHDNVCAQAKQDFAEMKKDYGVTWEFIKKLGNKGLAKLKEWYEIYSGK